MSTRLATNFTRQSLSLVASGRFSCGPCQTSYSALPSVSHNGCVAVRSYAKAAPTKIVYMCQACNKKQLKQDSMVAYLKKTVIVQCVGCHNIDDDLRWLSENNSKQEIVEAFKTHGLKVMGGPRFK